MFRTVSAYVIAAIVFAMVFANSVAAQERPRPALEFAAGSLLFADDGIVAETFGGGTIRTYLTPRLSVGPEIAFVQGDNHSHFMLTGNVTYDVLSQSTTSRVIPFVTAGGGLFQTREHFFSRDFSSTEGAFTAGGGLRALLGQRAIAGFEARAGWELHLRLSGFLGVRF